jgi:hypothetical protein
LFGRDASVWADARTTSGKGDGGCVLAGDCHSEVHVE